jgi:undecaprenyl-diphosphatase
MLDSDVQRAAEFLATRAILLLALAVVAAAAAVATVTGAIHALRRHRPVIRRSFAVVGEYIRRFDVVERAIARWRTFVPGGYLAVHLLLGLVATAAVVAFVVITEDVIGGGEIIQFDLAFANALRESATPGWTRVFAAVSTLGERETLAVAAAIVALRLLLADGVVMAGGWIAAQAGGGLLNLVLKESFERTRPTFADPLLATSSWSFPSGHAMGTFILLGLGCYMFLRDVQSWTVALLAVTVALSWCIVMAFSRLYLGVHFASDVAAGLVAGVAWVVVCASALEIVRGRQLVKAA